MVGWAISHIAGFNFVSILGNFVPGLWGRLNSFSTRIEHQNLHNVGSSPAKE